jgi:hypothetical protein
MQTQDKSLVYVPPFWAHATVAVAAAVAVAAEHCNLPPPTAVRGILYGMVAHPARVTAREINRLTREDVEIPKNVFVDTVLR